ncbi:MAG: hypothetical protein HYV97_10235 [Bdellovibrio sp.]|nr:hypothetical protein [Bdellovibrio sp.]
MKKQLLVSALGLALTTTVLAQGTTGQATVSTSSLVNTWNALKESPLSLLLIMDSGPTINQETVKVDGVTQEYDAFIGYKLSDNDSIKIHNAYLYEKRADTEAFSDFERINVGYTRSNILTEDKHGMGLSATVDARYRPTGYRRDYTNSYGQGRVSTKISKKMGAAGLSVTSYYARPQRLNKTDDMTTSTWENTVAQTYDFTDTLSLYMHQDFYLRNNPANKGEGKTLEVLVDLSKSITPDFSIDGYVKGLPINKKDHWDVDAHWTRAENLTYGLALNLTVF